MFSVTRYDGKLIHGHVCIKWQQRSFLQIHFSASPYYSINLSPVGVNFRTGQCVLSYLESNSRLMSFLFLTSLPTKESKSLYEQNEAILFVKTGDLVEKNESINYGSGSMTTLEAMWQFVFPSYPVDTLLKPRTYP